MGLLCCIYLCAAILKGRKDLTGPSRTARSPPGDPPGPPPGPPLGMAPPGREGEGGGEGGAGRPSTKRGARPLDMPNVFK